MSIAHSVEKVHYSIKQALDTPTLLRSWEGAGRVLVVARSCSAHLGGQLVAYAAFDSLRSPKSFA